MDAKPETRGAVFAAKRTKILGGRTYISFLDTAYVREFSHPPKKAENKVLSEVSSTLGTVRTCW